ncbi:hypothetical protein, partial [Rossellomorea marisflavi]|uniref:hypothetical protein n=1 Tax=Rossellomorea marisflavi TaxID=189381 RepID=UPI00295E8BBB
TQLIYNDANVQVIHFDYFKTPQDIFKTFDFTVCMAAYDFGSEEFVLHEDFLKHNSQRGLHFNSNTAFPIVSMLRVKKYEEKGYRISKPEFIRIVMTCMNLEINTYEELKDHLGGMYGVNYDKLFKDIEDEEFDIGKAVDLIANISLSDEYFTKPEPVNITDVEMIIDTISKKSIKTVSVNGKLHKIRYDGSLVTLDITPPYHEEVPLKDFLKEVKFYKYVKKTADGKYFSFYDASFEYVMSKEVEAKGEISNNYFDDRQGKLHMSMKQDLSSQYRYDHGSVLIELSVTPEAFLGAELGHITARKATALREVPKSEYEQWTSEELSVVEW